MSDVTLHLGDCLEYMRTLPDGCVDAVITDPPYGILPAAWDKVPDIITFTKEVKRVIRPTGFYVFFGQLPFALPWVNTAQLDFYFCEHIIWVKRNTMPGGTEHRLSRSHESVYIYSYKSGNRFHQIKGPYEDVKVPGVLFDTVTIEGIQRHIADMRLWIERGRPRIRNASKTSGRKEFHRIRNPTTFRLDSNYTNVWSFLPPAYTDKYTERHPTEKPVDVICRLIEMTVPEGAVILDPFMGSGTTGVGCVRTGRKFIGCEISSDYFALAERRIRETHAQPRLPFEDIETERHEQTTMEIEL